MDLFEIDRTTCKQDGICSEICPSGLINFQKGDYPEPIQGADEMCISCGHCVSACPTGSLKHRDIWPEQCMPYKKRFSIKRCSL